MGAKHNLPSKGRIAQKSIKPILTMKYIETDPKKHDFI